MKDSRDERLQIMLSQEELSALDDFRFKYRMPTRAAAVRELLKLGLASEELTIGDGGKSSSYGVVRRGAESRQGDDGTSEGA